eukprot:TRINITY_DN5180_c0_g2_i1.p2 TRINITY_DN5180_c0_g2~~TRINITY_DN5180_c0_g2_i1.p2  ORF type:complete len:171 (+),score=31.97 TRINITY_DN5180_c0_g2_i1:233-745(+)
MDLCKYLEIISKSSLGDLECRDLTRMFGGLDKAAKSLNLEVIRLVDDNKLNTDEQIRNFTNGQALSNIERSMEILVPAFEKEFSILEQLEWKLMTGAATRQRCVTLLTFIWYIITFIWFCKWIIAYEVKLLKATQILGKLYQPPSRSDRADLRAEYQCRQTVDKPTCINM